MRLHFFTNGIFSTSIAGGDIHFLKLAEGAVKAGYELNFFGGHALQEVIRKHNLPGTVTLTDSAAMPKTNTGALGGQVKLFRDFYGRYRRTMAALDTIGEDDLVYATSDYWFDVLPAVRSHARGKLMVWHMNAPGLGEIITRSRPDVDALRAASLHYWASQGHSLRRFAGCAHKHLFYLHPAMQPPLLRLGLRKDEMTYVSYGLEVTLNESVPAPPREFDAVWIGRVHRQKGIDDLLATLEFLAKRVENFRAIFIGNVKDALAPEIAKHGLEKHVTFSGFVSETEKIRLFKASRVFLMPSRHEGSPRVVGESIIANTPVVAYDIPNYRPVFGNFVRYVPAFDLNAFQSAAEDEITKMHAGDNYLAGLDLAEFKRANSWETTQGKFLAALERLRASGQKYTRMKIFALTIFAGAFLLFQVQPLIAKFILPWFGGGPGVWTTCMLFFQVFLLAGYAYAHLASRFFAVRTQAVVHWVLLLGSLMFLPIVPGEHWKPQTPENPAWHILVLLTLCLGLPYLVLAATGPLLQAWFNRLHPGVVPYRLYALSNVGSLLALLTYPFVFEPVFSRRTQAGIWAGSFGAFALLCGICAWQLWRAKPKAPSKGKNAKLPAQSPAVCPPTAAVKAWWFGLSACGSVLLLATTNKLCLDMPPVPFLWVLPLSLYLLTFVVCFDRPAWYVRKVFTLLLIPLLVLLCYAVSSTTEVSLRLQIIIYGGNLFVGCMICHGELYRLKPAPKFLTSFYLLIAAGGAAGGLFVGLLAPLLFRSYAELNWGVWLLAALVSGIYLREKIEVRLRNRRWLLWPVMLTGVLALGATLLLQSRRATRTAIDMNRNFYGVFRVVGVNTNTPFEAHKLNHGNTTHGLQFTEPSRATIATLYYNESSGVGMVLNNFPRQTNRRVGLVGLGAGTLAAYGRPGDTFRFYEINPEIQRLAETQFTFLKNSPARLEMVPGDARLSLEREPAQEFDLLVLDAFSSDSIPVHLLTREAFETYFRHLKPDGAIAVHITNRHLNLLPVMVGVAKQFHQLMITIAWDDPARPWVFFPSTWVILSRNRPFMLSQPMVSKAAVISDRDSANAFFWTDDYASLFRIVRF